MVATCRAIVKAIVGLGVDEEDRENTWMGDADECLKRGSVETARAIYAHVGWEDQMWSRREGAHACFQGTGVCMDHAIYGTVPFTGQCHKATSAWPP